MTEPAAIKRISHRRLPDGSYDNKPSDPKHLNKYYHNQGAELTTCYNCGVVCRKNYLNAHAKTNKCFKEMSKKLQTLRDKLPKLDF